MSLLQHKSKLFIHTSLLILVTLQLNCIYVLIFILLNLTYTFRLELFILYLRANKNTMPSSEHELLKGIHIIITRTYIKLVKILWPSLPSLPLGSFWHFHKFEKLANNKTMRLGMNNNFWKNIYCSTKVASTHVSWIIN